LKNAVKTFSKYFLSLFLILPAFCISFFGLSIFYVMIAIVLAFVIYFWFLYRFDSALHDYFANYISRLTLRITKK
jgi:Ca2+/Na+ antiporter